MDRKQFACLELLLPGFLAERTDPVIVSLLSCSPQATLSASSNSQVDPVMKPKIKMDGDKTVSDKVYFLTKNQIRCLYQNLESLKQAKGPRISFDFVGCKR